MSALKLVFQPTERHFAAYTFEDRYGSLCSLQKSSIATKDAIWLGIEIPFITRKEAATRMHLTREQVAELLPHLQHFVETGELKVPD